MPDLPHLNTTESVIKVMWDILLVFFVVKISFAYFLMTLTIGIILSYLAWTRLLPINNLAPPQPELIMMTLQLAVITFSARFIISYFEVPKNRWFRLAIGATSLLLMLLAEFLKAVFIYEAEYAGWITETNGKVGLPFACLMIAFALMPFGLIFTETKSDVDKETCHGDEKRRHVAFVPTVQEIEETGIQEVWDI